MMRSCSKIKCRASEEDIVEPILIYIIVVLNCLQFFVGIGFIVGGSWLVHQSNSYQSGANVQNIFDLAGDLGVFLIIIGIICIFLALIGIVAAVRQNKRLLAFYTIIIGIVMLVSAVSGVIFLIFEGKIIAAITNTLKTQYIAEYFDDSNVQDLFDLLQGTYSCCGINSYLDWSNNPYYSCSTINSALACFVPDSCCVGYQENQDTINLFCSGQVLNSLNATSFSNIYTTGCVGQINSIATLGINIFGGILVAIAVFMLVELVLIQFLMDMIKKEQSLHNSHFHLKDMVTSMTTHDDD